MMHRFLLILALFSFVGVARADEVAPLLDKMHEAGRDLQTLSARVDLLDYDATTGNEVERPGTMKLRRATDGGEGAAVHVLFDGRNTDRGFDPTDKIEYLYKDGELVDRNYRGKTQVVRRLPEKDRNRDPLDLGEGPFPLPIGQDPAEVRRLFEVSIYNPADGDLNVWDVEPVEGTTRVRLVPRPDTRFADEFRFVDVDVDPATGLPAKVATVDVAEVNLRIATLRDIARNADLAGESFELEDVDLRDWNVSFEDLSKPEEAKP